MTLASEARPRSAGTHGDPAPLSFAQRRLWLLDRLEPGARYNIPLAWRLTGDLDEQALLDALAAVVARHEALRTVVVEHDGEPVQEVRPPSAFRVERPTVPDSPQAVRDHLDRVAARRFDLAGDLPLRAHLARLGEGAWLLAIVVHHIAFDGWSERVLGDELAALYAAFRAGRPDPLPPLALQYADVARDERRRFADPATRAREDAYWREALAGAPMRLALPVDRPRAAAPTPAAPGFIEQRLDPETARALGAFARRERVTLAMAVHAAFAALLARWTGTDDILIGVPVANRARRDHEALIGVFVDTLVLRLRLDGDTTAREALALARKAALGAFGHAAMPFERLVDLLRPDRLAGENPVFQVSLSQQNAFDDRLILPGATAERILVDEAAKLDLVLYYAKSADGGIDLLWEYQAALFDRPTIERLGERLGVLVAAMAARPDAPILALPWLPDHERAAIAAAAGPASLFAPARSLVDLIGERVRAAPDAPAVEAAGAVLSYRDLDLAANRVAHRLIAAGVGREDIVGVLIDRSPTAIAACLGVLKAGAAFVPLHAKSPDHRLSTLLRGVGARALLVDDAAARRGAAGGLPLLRADAPALAGEPATAPDIACLPDQLAYVIFTSGSTGEPKAIGASHRNIASFASHEDWQTGDRARTLHHSAPSFDGTWMEIWPPLLGGGTIVLAPPGELDLAALEGVLRDGRVDFAFIATGLFNLIAETRPELFDGPRVVATGGDSASPDAFRRAAARAPATRFENFYGPTETTISSTRHVFGDDGTPGAAVPIGRPLWNTRAYVLDDRLEPLPDGVPGELYIAGTGVARGYLGQPRATAERFVADPFGPPGTRMYRTGDRVRRLADGALVFLGRADGQVKLRGFRIEPAEIEAALRGHAAVADAAVVVREDVPGDRRLAGYVTAAAGERPEPEALRRHLAERLPDYMVPPTITVLDAFPLTAHGKRDRRALPVPRAPDRTVVGPRGAEERLLAALVAEILSVDRVSVEDSFVDAGGNSLAAVRLTALLERRHGRDLPLASVMAGRSIADLARELGRSAAAAIRPVPLNRAGAARSLFCLPTATGAVAPYGGLARRLDGRRSVYGLPSPIGPRRTVAWTPARLADRHADASAAAQPDGPVSLLGWSFAGMLADATVHALVRRGRVVDRIILIDVPLSGAHIPLAEADLRDEYDRTLARTGRPADGTGAPPDADGDAALFAVFRNHLEVFRDYAVGRPAARPLVVVAGEETDGASPRAADWIDRGVRADDILTVAADHYAVLERIDAAALLARLDGAGPGAGR